MARKWYLSLIPLITLFLLIPSHSYATSRGEGFILDKMALIKRLSSIINEKTVSWNARVLIKSFSIPDHIEMYPGETLQIIVGNGKIRPGANPVVFRVLHKNRPIKTLGGNFFLDVWKALPCAARPLNRGEVLTPDKITYVEKNLAYISSPVWDGRSGPWRIKIPIGRLQVITMSHIEPVPVVERNQKVNLIFNGRAIYLKVVALALKDGNMGDIIPVLNLQSKKVVYAKVVGHDTVAIQ